MKKQKQNNNNNKNALSIFKPESIQKIWQCIHCRKVYATHSVAAIIIVL